MKIVKMLFWFSLYNNQIMWRCLWRDIVTWIKIFVISSLISSSFNFIIFMMKFLCSRPIDSRDCFDCSATNYKTIVKSFDTIITNFQYPYNCSGLTLNQNNNTRARKIDKMGVFINTFIFSKNLSSKNRKGSFSDWN